MLPKTIVPPKNAAAAFDTCGKHDLFGILPGQFYVSQPGTFLGHIFAQLSGQVCALAVSSANLSKCLHATAWQELTDWLAA
eukprot:67426-Lingulodinium_polyedra.AAC.1